tara:strand:+ start:1193 stop:1816 length:624 start_codon:yes stop_codon:yes gene_type:complete
MVGQAEKYEQAGIDALGKMNRPTPGESLTNNPDNPLPFEQPPEFTETKEALDWLLGSLTQEETFVDIVSAVDKGIPISEIVQQLLYLGFSEGKWNPDLILLLVEPVMYMIMSLCEKAGVQYTIYRGEENDVDELDAEEKLAQSSSKLKNLGALIENKASSSSITSANIPQAIREDVEAIELPEELSLMAKPEAPTQTENNNSILARG